MGERFRDAVHRLGTWLRPILRDRHRRDLEDELDFHLEMETAKGVRDGLTPDEARRSARVAFGGEERFKEEVRDVDGVTRIESVVGDLGYAVRLLRRNPWQTALLLIALAAAFGPVAGISWAAYPLLAGGLPFEASDELFALRQSTPEGGSLPISLPDLEVWAAAEPRLESAAGYDPTTTTYRGPSGDRRRLDGAEITAGFFATLGVEPALGRSFTEREDVPGASPLVVVSHELWMEGYAGSADAMGETLVLAGEPYTIVGVMPAGFAFPTGARYWVSAGRQEPYQDPLNFDLVGVARIRPGMVESVRAGTESVRGRLLEANPGRDPDLVLTVTPLRDLLVPPEIQAAAKLLVVGVLLLLALGIVTSGHLVLVRHRARDGELRTRLRLGATAGRVLRQLLVEGTLASAAALLLAAPIAWMLHGSLSSLARTEAPGLSSSAPGGVWLVATLGVGFAVLLVTTAIPATRWWVGASRRGPSVDRGSPRRRTVLVTTQVAVAVVLLTGALVAAAGVARITETDPGYQREGIVTALASFPSDAFDERDARRALVRSVLDEIDAAPGLSGAAATLRTPVTGARIDLAVETEVGGTQVVAAFNGATERLFETLGIEVVRGRGFSPLDDGSGDPVAIVSERLTNELWGSADPIDRGLRLGDDRNSVDPDAPLHRVVGVVRDIRHEGYVGDARSAVWIPYDQFPAFYATFVARAADGSDAGAVQALTAALRGASPELLVQRVEPLGRMLDDSVARPRLLSRVMVVLAFTAMALTLTGTYAVVLWWTHERRREVGIRRALGATAIGVLGWVSAWVARATLVGAVLGAAMLVPALGYLETASWGIATELRWPAIAFLTVASTTLLASVAPARRVVHSSIASALRGD